MRNRDWLPRPTIRPTHPFAPPARPPIRPTRLLDRVEVEVSEGWLQQMRLATAEPERAARLLMAGAAARSSSSSGGLLLEGPAAAAAGASARCVSWAGEMVARFGCVLCSLL